METLFLAPNKPPELADFPVVIRLPVQWGDQDAFGHVNNAVAFRWFESARTAYLDVGGFDHFMGHGGLGPILAAINCNYRKQLKYPDFVLVGARVTKLGNRSLGIGYAVYSEQQKSIVYEGDSVLVLFDYDRQTSVSLPEEFRAAVEKIEGRSFSR